MNSRFVAIMAVLVLGFVGFIVFSKNSENNAGSTAGQTSKHTYGEGKKQVTLVEYGDFECPACAAYYPVVKQVKEKYKEDITFQFVNFPLTSIHLNAMAAHRAAEAADKQGKFWEMHDLLYEQRDSWISEGNAVSRLEKFAEQLGLDMTKFREDAASSSANDTIQADLKLGQEQKVTSTPTFFLDGKKLDNPPQDLDGFSKIIDEAIKAKQQ